MSDRLTEMAEKLRAGRELNEFDEQAVLAVAGLYLRLQDAQRAIANEGTIVDDGKGMPIEHPALVIEKRASQEIRGWVKDRPDLFGEQKQKTQRSQRPAFKVVS